MATSTTRFDYLITPDGREVPIEGNSTTRDSKGKAAAKVVGRAAGYTAFGGVVGTMLVLKYGGLAAAVASHGIRPGGWSGHWWGCRADNRHADEG